MGPLLLGRLFNLNDTQQGVLALVFKIADDNGLLLLDMKDLRAMLQFVGDNAKNFTVQYGNISAASIGAIQRSLLEIEQQGGQSLLWRVDARYQRPDADEQRRPRCDQYSRRREANEFAQVVFDVPVVDIVRAVRAPARNWRS